MSERAGAAAEVVRRVRLTLWPLAVAVSIGFGLWLGIQILDRVLWVLFLLVLALILAAALMPGVRLIRGATFPPGGWRAPKWLAVLIIYLLVVVVVGAVLFFIGRTIAQQSVSLLQSLPNIAQNVATSIRGIADSLGVGFLAPSPSAIGEEVQRFTTSSLQPFSLATSVATGFVDLVIRFIIVVMLALFLVTESDQILDFWIYLFPRQQQDQVRELTTRVGDRVGRWLVGQLAVATITGTLSALAAYLFGFPYPYLFGIVTMMLDLAPIVGATLIVLPAFLLGLSQSVLIAVAALLVYFAIAMFDGHVLSPLITGKAVSLSPVLIILAVPMGLALYGAIGALIAVPVTASVQVFFSEIILPWLKNREQVGEDRRGQVRTERREAEAEEAA